MAELWCHHVTAWTHSACEPRRASVSQDVRARAATVTVTCDIPPTAAPALPAPRVWPPAQFKVINRCALIAPLSAHLIILTFCQNNVLFISIHVVIGPVTFLLYFFKSGCLVVAVGLFWLFPYRCGHAALSSRGLGWAMTVSCLECMGL
ncbi:hypothetical protein J6590_034560 [Homalodisca vitripennis]|nr:hypothetical protein J6590_034560 [Homalodisca vitripennis]